MAYRRHHAPLKKNSDLLLLINVGYALIRQFRISEQYFFAKCEVIFYEQGQSRVLHPRKNRHTV